MPDREDNFGAARIRLIGIVGNAIPSADAISIGAGVMHVEIAIVLLVGMEGQSQEAPLASRVDERGNVQEGRGQDRAVVHDPDPTGLFQDEEPGIVGTDARDEERSLEIRGDRLSLITAALALGVPRPVRNSTAMSALWSRNLVRRG